MLENICPHQKSTFVCICKTCSVYILYLFVVVKTCKSLDLFNERVVCLAIKGMNYWYKKLSNCQVQHVEWKKHQNQNVTHCDYNYIEVLKWQNYKD